MNDALSELFEVVKDRKINPQEGSYTCYLFNAGLDKILKKAGEECAETIIAAKNGDNNELKMEICDLFYHILVLMEERGLALSEVYMELGYRAAKIGNLKDMKETDKNS